MHKETFSMQTVFRSAKVQNSFYQRNNWSKIILNQMKKEKAIYREIKSLEEDQWPSSDNSPKWKRVLSKNYHDLDQIETVKNK